MLRELCELSAGRDGDHICNMDPSKVVLEEYSFLRITFGAAAAFGRRNRECITTNVRYAG